MEKETREALESFQKQLDQYGKLLDDMARFLDVAEALQKYGNTTKERAVGTAEVVKAHHATDNDPED